MFFRRFLGHALSKLILPAQFFHKKPLPRQERFLNIVSKAINRPQSKIVFSEFALKLEDKYLKKQKIIIHVTGNADCYENHIVEYILLAKKFPTRRIVAFNMRGVSNSEGHAYSEEDWMNDTIAVINYYRKKGVPTENILLHGHSLGGAIVTLAAAKLYAQDKKKALKNAAVSSVRIINDRSFSSLPAEIVHSMLGPVLSGLILVVLFSPILLWVTAMALLEATLWVSASLIAGSLFVRDFSQRVLEPLLDALLWTLFGTLNAAQAYKALPVDAKEYVIARDDRVIAKKASLHHALKDERTQSKAKLRHDMQYEKDLPKPKGWTRKQEIKDLNSKLLNIKDCKLGPTDLDIENEANWHVLPLGVLQTAHKMRGADKPSKNISGLEVVENKTRRLLKI